MTVTYKVNWSEKSKEITSKIVNYLLQEWTKKEVSLFLNNLKKFEKIVSFFPKSYPKSISEPKIRKAVISKHFSVINK